MKGDSRELSAERRQAWRRDAVDGAEANQQFQRRLDAVGRRRLEPFEGQRVGAPRDQIEQGCGEVDAGDLRFAVWAQSVGRRPQPANQARPQPCGPAGALVRGILRHALERQAVDATLGVVPRHLHLSRVDDDRHAWHGQRRLGNVRGQDDPSSQPMRESPRPAPRRRATRAAPRRRGRTWLPRSSTLPARVQSHAGLAGSTGGGHASGEPTRAPRRRRIAPARNR